MLFFLRMPCQVSNNVYSTSETNFTHYSKAAQYKTELKILQIRPKLLIYTNFWLHVPDRRFTSCQRGLNVVIYVFKLIKHRVRGRVQSFGKLLSY